MMYVAPLICVVTNNVVTQMYLVTRVMYVLCSQQAEVGSPCQPTCYSFMYLVTHRMLSLKCSHTNDISSHSILNAVTQVMQSVAAGEEELEIGARGACGECITECSPAHYAATHCIVTPESPAPPAAAAAATWFCRSPCAHPSST